MPAPTKSDKALERSRARAEFRKEIVTAGAESQVKIARERGRQRRSVEKAKTQQRVIERQQSEAARVSAYRQRSEIAIAQRAANRQQRVQTQKDLQQLQRNDRIVQGTSKAVTSTSVWSTLMLFTTLMFGMILLYVLVTNGQAFGNLAGSVGTFIQGLSSNQPLFVRKEAST